MAATARKATDKGLSRVKKALERGENPLSAAVADFVQTCCRILGINSEEKINEIGRRAVEDSKGNVQKVMSAITMLLDELGDKVKGHQRNSPGPSLSTRSYDDMDAPVRSLQHLQASVKGVRDMTVRGFARGIKVAELDLENSMEDFRITVERTGEAARWDEATINDWMEKGWAAFRDVMKEVAEAIWRAEAREGKGVTDGG
jgi:hypothetical protein